MVPIRRASRIFVRSENLFDEVPEDADGESLFIVIECERKKHKPKSGLRKGALCEQPRMNDSLGKCHGEWSPCSEGQETFSEPPEQERERRESPSSGRD